MSTNTQSPWYSYMGDIYRSRKAPQPLGAVVFEEIKAKAKEKLKDYPGELEVVLLMNRA